MYTRALEPSHFLHTINKTLSSQPLNTDASKILFLPFTDHTKQISQMSLCYWSHASPLFVQTPVGISDLRPAGACRIVTTQKPVKSEGKSSLHRLRYQRCREGSEGRKCFAAGKKCNGVLRVKLMKAC